MNWARVKHRYNYRLRFSCGLSQKCAKGINIQQKKTLRQLFCVLVRHLSSQVDVQCEAKPLECNTILNVNIGFS